MRDSGTEQCSRLGLPWIGRRSWPGQAAAAEAWVLGEAAAEAGVLAVSAAVEVLAGQPNASRRFAEPRKVGQSQTELLFGTDRPHHYSVTFQIVVAAAVLLVGVSAAYQTQSYDRSPAAGEQTSVASTSPASCRDDASAEVQHVPRVSTSHSW